jgi:hypothetical protein
MSPGLTEYPEHYNLCCLCGLEQGPAERDASIGERSIFCECPVINELISGREVVHTDRVLILARIRL